MLRIEGAIDSAKDFTALLGIQNGDLEIRINSGGGSVIEGIAIHNAIKAYDRGKIKVVVEGLCASIATYVAIAGDEVHVYTNTVWMIHNGWTMTQGDHAKLRETANLLERLSNVLAEGYSKKTGIPVEQIKELMDAETYYFGKEIVEAKFADASLECDSGECNIEEAKASINRYVNYDFQQIQGEQLMEEEKTELETLLAENTRVANIYDVCAKIEVPNELRYEYLVDKTKTAQDLKDALLEKLVASSKHTITVSEPKQSALKSLMQEVIEVKYGLAESTNPDVKKYKGATLLDISKVLLGNKLETHNSIEIAQAAMRSSDLPTLLTSTIKKSIREEMEESGATYEQVSQYQEVKDFRPQKSVQVGGFGYMNEYEEGGDRHKTRFGETDEEIWVKEYAEELEYTYKMIVNDQFGVLMQRVQALGQMASRTTDALIYDILTGGAIVKDFSAYTMKDGLPIFHANHGNVTNTTLTEASLSVARATMQKQKLRSGAYAYNVPKVLIVGPDLEATAKRLTMSASTTETGLNNGVINVHQGTLQVVVSPYIAGDAWYLTSLRDGLVHVGLEATGKTPILNELTDGSVLYKKYELVYHTGASVLEYKSLFRGK